jgi:hypothetical protein
MLNKRRNRQIINSLVRGEVPELSDTKNYLLIATGSDPIHDRYTLNGEEITKEEADEFRRLHPDMEDVSLTLDIN